MFDATSYTTENDAVDWHALADQLFPVEALQSAPAFNPLAVFRSGN
jgi:hypothetical protein